MHSVKHGIDGGDGVLGGGGSELGLVRCLVDACGDGLCLLVDGALGRLEVASDEFEGDFEERSVEDDLVVGHKLGRVAHSPISHSRAFRSGANGAVCDRLGYLPLVQGWCVLAG